METERGYAKSAGAYLGYSVRGDAAIDLLYINNNTVSMDSLAEEPHAARFFDRIAGFTRLLQYHVRGVGISDPIDPARLPTPPQGAADTCAVLDAVDSDRVVVAGEAGGGLIAIELAASEPARVSALILVNTCARASLRPTTTQSASPRSCSRRSSRTTSIPTRRGRCKGVTTCR